MRLPIAAVFLLAVFGQLAAAEDFPYDAPNSLTPTFTRDIEPRFRMRCAHCHGPGRMRPENFSDYATVLAMKDELVEHVLVDRDMPMGMRFDPASLALIDAWIKAGQPL